VLLCVRNEERAPLTDVRPKLFPLTVLLVLVVRFWAGVGVTLIRLRFLTRLCLTEPDSQLSPPVLYEKEESKRPRQKNTLV
jgi:hypothetical protein